MVIVEGEKLNMRVGKILTVSYILIKQNKVKAKLLIHVQLFATPWTVTRLLHLWDFPGKSTGVGCHFLLQRIFLTRNQTRVSRIVADALPFEPPGKIYPNKPPLIESLSGGGVGAVNRYIVTFRCTTKWFDVCIYYKMITIMSLVNICHHSYKFFSCDENFQDLFS